ncbi:hypothetical protein JJD28_15005, partial [Listeria monocytogenes]
KLSTISKEKLLKNYILNQISQAKTSENFYGEDFAFNPKTLLINMLKTLKNSPFKKSQISSLQISKMPLLEVFIAMFLD